MLVLIFYIGFGYIEYIPFEVLCLFFLMRLLIIYLIIYYAPVYMKILIAFSKFIKILKESVTSIIKVLKESIIFIMKTLYNTRINITKLPYILEVFLICYEKRILISYFIMRVTLMFLQITTIIIFNLIPWIGGLLYSLIPLISAWIPLLSDLSLTLIPIICFDSPDITFLSNNNVSDSPSTSSSPSINSPSGTFSPPNVPSPASWEQSNPVSAISTPDLQINPARMGLFAWEVYFNMMGNIEMPYVPILDQGETIADLANTEPSFPFGFIEFNDAVSRPNVHGIGIAGSSFIENNIYNPNAHQANASLSMMAATWGLVEDRWIIFKSDLSNATTINDIENTHPNYSIRTNFLEYFRSYYNYISRMDLFDRHRDVLIVDKSLLGIFVEPWRDLASTNDPARNIDLRVTSFHPSPLTWDNLVNNVNQTPFSLNMNTNIGLGITSNLNTSLSNVNLSVYPSIENRNDESLSLNESHRSSSVHSLSSNNSSSISSLSELLNANRSVWDRANSLSLSEQFTGNVFISDSTNVIRDGEASSSSNIINEVEIKSSSSRASSILGEKETFEKAFSEERKNNITRKRSFSEAFPDE